MISVNLGDDLRSAGIARACVKDALAGHPDSVRDVAILLADELVTNALVHGEGDIGLRVDVSQGAVRVDVFDEAQGAPVIRKVTPGHTHGRGMRIVDSLASSWGVDELPSGKNVWFRLDFAVAS